MSYIKPHRQDSNLHDHVEKIRESGLFAKGSRLANLFEFLAARVDQTETPKESLIAEKVFGKVTFQPGDDATVRVYIHRLRKKLDEFYASSPPQDGRRIELKLGEYRFVLSGNARGEESQAELHSVFLKHWRVVSALGVSLLACSIFVMSTIFATTRDNAPAINEIWAPHHTSPLETLIVVGDYYLYGENHSGLYVSRLVRDFEINSATDLETAKRTRPEQFAEAQNIDLHYLPVSVGYALTNISPLLNRKGEVLRFLPASRVTPEIASHYDIVYIGLLSAIPFTSSRLPPQSGFLIGETLDEIVDRDTDAVFRSEEIAGVAGDVEYRDYGYIGTFAGPVGNVLTIIAGTRDTGLKGAAAIASQEKLDRGFASAFENNLQVEALIEVRGVDQVNTFQEIVAIKN